MNQPVRAYPMNQNNLELGQKPLHINTSPQIKKRMLPITDNQYLIQLSSTKQIIPALDSPGKLRMKIVKSPKIDIEKSGILPLKVDKEVDRRNQQIISYSEQNSPMKKPNLDNQSKFFLKGSYSQEDQLKFPTLEQSSPLKRNTTASKDPKEVRNSLSMQEKKEVNLSTKLRITRNDFFNPKQANKNEKSDKRIDLVEPNSSSKTNILKDSFSPIKYNRQIQIDQTKQASGVAHGRSASNPSFFNKNTQSEYEEQKNGNLLKLIVQKSQPGQNSNKQTKTNQDSVFYCSNYNGLKSRSFIGVCDGHGTYGHFVSQIIKKILPQHLDSYLKQQFGKTPSAEDLGSKEETQVLRAFAQAFQKTSKEINSCGVDVTFSGTTCVTVLITGPHIWCANIGDSRAVLYFLKNGMWNIQPLSNDHKPDNPLEMKRIQNAKGRVEPYFGSDGQPIGPARVWLLHDQVPGLAMSRSFGDYVASTVGVVADPEVTYFKIDFEQGFLVVASDGVWEFLSNEKVCEILQNYPIENVNVSVLDQMATHIIKESTKQWQIEDEVIDDISVIIGLIQK